MPLCLLCPRFQAPFLEKARAAIMGPRPRSSVTQPSQGGSRSGSNWAQVPSLTAAPGQGWWDQGGAAGAGRVTGVAERRVSWAAAPGVSLAAIPGVSRAIPAAVMGMALAAACTLSWCLWLRGSPGPTPVTVVSLDLSLRVAPRGALRRALRGWRGEPRACLHLQGWGAAPQ